MPFKLQVMSTGFSAQLDDLLRDKDMKSLKEKAHFVSNMGNPKDLTRSAQVFGKLGIDVDLDLMVANTSYHGLWFFKPATEEEILASLSGAEPKKLKAASPVSVRAKMVADRVHLISKMITEDNMAKRETIDKDPLNSWPKWMQPQKMAFSVFSYPSSLKEFEDLMNHVDTVCLYAFNVRMVKKWYEKTKHTLKDEDIAAGSDITKTLHVMEM